MSIHQKADGRWFCVYYRHRKQIWEAFGRGDRGQAGAKARDLEIKLSRLQPEDDGDYAGRSLTFHQLCQLYMNDRGPDLSASTRHGILTCISRYARPEIGALPVSRLTMAHWQQIEKRMRRTGIKNRTINTYYRYISGILTWAVMENSGILKAHPWQKRKRLKEKKYHLKLFTMDELRSIMDHAEDHLAWAIQVAYHTGVRPGEKELFSLRWENLDLPNKRIWICSSKTDAARWQYLPKKFIAALTRRQRQDQKDYPDCPYICHYQGRPIKSIKTAWNAAKRRAGITRPLRMYDIRHYHITYALAAGADIHDLAVRVGHKSPQMIVNVYSHLAKDVLQNQAHQLPELTPAPPPKTPPMDILY